MCVLVCVRVYVCVCAFVCVCAVLRCARAPVRLSTVAMCASICVHACACARVAHHFVCVTHHCVCGCVGGWMGGCVGRASLLRILCVCVRARGCSQAQVRAHGCVCGRARVRVRACISGCRRRRLLDDLVGGEPVQILEVVIARADATAPDSIVEVGGPPQICNAYFVRRIAALRRWNATCRQTRRRGRRRPAR